MRPTTRLSIPRRFTATQSSQTEIFHLSSFPFEVPDDHPARGSIQTANSFFERQLEGPLRDHTCLLTHNLVARDSNGAYVRAGDLQGLNTFGSFSDGLFALGLSHSAETPLSPLSGPLPDFEELCRDLISSSFVTALTPSNLELVVRVRRSFSRPKASTPHKPRIPLGVPPLGVPPTGVPSTVIEYETVSPSSSVTSSEAKPQRNPATPDGWGKRQPKNDSPSGSGGGLGGGGKAGGASGDMSTSSAVGAGSSTAGETDTKMNVGAGTASKDQKQHTAAVTSPLYDLGQRTPPQEQMTATPRLTPSTSTPWTQAGSASSASTVPSSVPLQSAKNPGDRNNVDCDTAADEPPCDCAVHQQYGHRPVLILAITAQETTQLFNLRLAGALGAVRAA